jgi:hypothetical protein
MTFSVESMCNANRLTAIAFGPAVAGRLPAGLPVYSGFEDERPTHAALPRVSRWLAIVPMMFPVLVEGVPLLFRKRGVRIAACRRDGWLASRNQLTRSPVPKVHNQEQP